MSIIEGISAYVQRRIGKWRTVLRWIDSGCDAPMTAYLETLPGALKDPIIMLLDFGLDDVARGALRPKGIYRKTHLRRRRDKRIPIGIPELGEEIGKRLPGAQALKARRVGPLEKSLWLIDGVIQRGLYYLLIADVATTFAYGWVTALKERGYCRESARGRILQSGRVYRAPVQGQWYMIQGATPLWSTSWVQISESQSWVVYERTAGPAMPTTLIIAMTVDYPPTILLDPSWADITVHASDDHGSVLLRTWHIPAVPGVTTPYTIRIDIPPCRFIHLYAPITYPWYPPVDITATITQEAVWLMDA